MTVTTLQFVDEQPSAGARAACADHRNPEWFIEPLTRQQYDSAIAVCKHVCQRTAECLLEAQTAGDAWGVWGGVNFTHGKARTRFLPPRGPQQRRAAEGADGGSGAGAA